MVYDLTLEMSWHSTDQPVDLSSWIVEYATRRYGAASASTGAIWRSLLSLVYNATSGGGVPKSLVELQPGLSMLHDGFMPTLLEYDPQALVAVWKQLRQPDLVAQFGSTETYMFDLVDVTRQVLVNYFIWVQGNLSSTFSSNTTTADDVTKWASLALEVISDLDSLLASNSHFLVGQWIATALSWAHTAEQADWLEYNARNQITLWGPSGQINDYASKQWGGLIGSYYYSRWKLFGDTLVSCKKSGQPFNQSTYDAAVLRWASNGVRIRRLFPYIRAATPSKSSK